MRGRGPTLDNKVTPIAKPHLQGCYRIEEQNLSPEVIYDENEQTNIMSCINDMNMPQTTATRNSDKSLERHQCMQGHTVDSPG